MGLAVGFISGMFGIGGGFLLPPLLIFVGISPAVAVASVASHIAASSCSGVITYWRRRAVALSLGLMFFAGRLLRTAGGGGDGKKNVRDNRAAKAGQAGHAAARRRAHLGPWPAAQDAVQTVEDLCLG